MASAPKLDDRTAAQLDQELRKLILSRLQQDWPGMSSVEDSGPLAALIAIGARFGEIVIERLNRTPDKTLLAYLDLLAVSRLQAQPAYVPITFQLAPGAVQDAFAPEGTQVAASVQGESEAIVFETERDLVITPVRLPAVFALDRAIGRYYEWRSEVEDRPEKLVLGEGCNVEHILYAGHSSLLGLAGLTAAGIRVDLEQPAAAPLDVRWELFGATGWEALDTAADSTGGLTRSGEITLPVAPAVAETEVNGRRGRWVRMRSAQVIRPGDPLPKIRSLRFHLAAKREHLRPEMVFSDAAPLDATKDFFPFGTRPLFGAAFYLSSSELFATPSALAVLHIQLTNPASGESESPIPRVNAVHAARLQWETFDGAEWQPVGLSSTTTEANDAFPGFKDETRAFTQSGNVLIPLPPRLGAAMVNGRSGYWLRVRLTGGNYGAERPLAKTEAERSDLAPPAIRSLEFEYSLQVEAPPESLLLYNDFAWSEADPASAFTPWFTADDRTAALYFGFVPPAARGAQPFTNRTVALYFSLTAELVPGIAQQTIAWEYWKGKSWQKWSVTDATTSFSRSGAVWILPPRDMAYRDEFGMNALWFRAVLPPGSFAPEPLRGVYLNTVGAWQSRTVRDETLGASNATPDQSFFTLNFPVLPGQTLEVWEAGPPPHSEQAAIRRAEGESAIREEKERAEGGVWVTWHDTFDLYDSGPRERHYVMHNSTGEVVFGDGTHGLIPPPGASNIRMRTYRTGGGLRGNKLSPGEISQLKTTLPYVAKAFNPESPAGGADAETDAAVRLRGPRILRHRDRAVTVEDYEDIAMMASPEVARTKAVPLRDLQADPLGSRVLPGTVTVIVVPKSLEAKPVPRPLLLSRVRDYLDQRRLPSVRLAVVGPCYVRVDVHAVVAADALGYPNVELDIIGRLQTFLHPLTGGPHGTGWKFGRRLRASDLYKVIAPVPGVRYVSSLDLHQQEEPPGVLERAYFLVYSGDKHRIEIVPPEM